MRAFVCACVVRTCGVVRAADQKLESGCESGCESVFGSGGRHGVSTHVMGGDRSVAQAYLQKLGLLLLLSAGWPRRLDRFLAHVCRHINSLQLIQLLEWVTCMHFLGV